MGRTVRLRGKYFARIRYTIDDSKPLDIMRQVENKSAIKPKQAEIEVELRQHGPAQLVAGKVTFRQLAQYAKDNIYVAAVYDDQETVVLLLDQISVLFPLQSAPLSRWFAFKESSFLAPN